MPQPARGSSGGWPRRSVAPISFTMGWRDRDWAKFTDEERRLLYGGGRPKRSCSRRSSSLPSGSASHADGGPGSYTVSTRGFAKPACESRSLRPLVWGSLAAIIIAVSAFAYAERPRPGVPNTEAPTQSVVYGGQTALGKDGSNERLACTAEGANVRLRVWVCTEWTILQPGQVVAPAIDPGGQCGVHHADQATGRWVCDSRIPPKPSSLPRP
jgi:hypothetical protein